MLVALCATVITEYNCRCTGFQSDQTEMKTANSLINVLGRYILALILGVGVYAFDSQSGYGQGKKSREKSRVNLEKIEAELSQAKKREDELSARRIRLGEESARLRKELIAGAARLQAREAQATDTEFRLAKLTRNEGKINKRLVLERGKLAELLAGLQRIERSPPPALAVLPKNALDAIRSAMLLGTIIPEIKQEANALARELQTLDKLRKDIAIEQSDLRQTTAKLVIDRREIKRLLKTKKSARRQADQDIRLERQRVASLGQQAKSLKDLLAKIKIRAIKKKPVKKIKKATVPEIKLAQLTPAVKFSKNRRALSFPVQGERIKNFGDADGFGSVVRGLSIASRSLAQVISPNDGTIVYAGNFRGYGELLIINAGEGYHVLLAGMERITTDVGQFVLAGEPVGSMGASAAPSAALGAKSGDDRPILYIEFRRNGLPLDPTPWWVGNVTKARG